MDFLDKVEKAISDIEDSPYTSMNVQLNYAELRTIRRYILLENYNADLAAENLRKGMKLRKKIK